MTGDGICSPHEAPRNSVIWWSSVPVSFMRVTLVAYGQGHVSQGMRLTRSLGTAYVPCCIPAPVLAPSFQVIIILFPEDARVRRGWRR